MHMAVVLDLDIAVCNKVFEVREKPVGHELGQKRWGGCEVYNAMLDSMHWKGSGTMSSDTLVVCFGAMTASMR